MNRICIIGAGLAGSLLAIYLAKRGFQINVFEARGDMRLEELAAGRSINLALSDRGIGALREVGMDEYMLAEAVPMYGRMIHSVSSGTKLLPYSGRQGEYINSVSRAGLNIALMNEADKYPNVQFVFNERCVDFDCKYGEAMFASGRTMRGDTVIATDGAGSTVRQALERQVSDFESSSVFLEHGYKELHIPAGAAGSFAIEKNALHIWPRHKFMMIALPNFDGSFTCTLFLAHKGVASAVVDGGMQKPDGGRNDQAERNALTNVRASASSAPADSFDQLTDSAAIQEFFSREFPDAVPLMPTLVEDFVDNPTGQLGTVKCWPWNVGGKALLLGDSAHAMVPFYGQGMNCAFEDVRVLIDLMDKGGSLPTRVSDWEAIYEEYNALRKPNTDAIQDMAEENFFEMRDATANAVFQRKRDLETRLEQSFPAYFSKYSMVTFREDIPYSVAKQRGNAQDTLLMKICSEIPDLNSLDLGQVMRQVESLYNTNP